jgi:hypothetical protein
MVIGREIVNSGLISRDIEKTGTQKRMPYNDDDGICCTETEIYGEKQKDCSTAVKRLFLTK